MTNRERLRSLLSLLDEAPFDVQQLRAQVASASRDLPDEEAGEILKQTLRELDAVQTHISQGQPDSSDEAHAHQYAIDWLATARATLKDYTLN